MERNMSDLISREKAFDMLSEYYHHRLDSQHLALREALSRVPSAEPETHDNARKTHSCVSKRTETHDLISRKAAIERIRMQMDRPDSVGQWAHNDKIAKVCYRIVIEKLENLPSVEPEIVRCKDCKHKYIEEKVWNCPFGLSGGEEFFCSYGARMERENDE